MEFADFRQRAGVFVLVASLFGVASPAFAGIEFEDVSTAAGFVYQGESYGASWGDLDGDGLPDLFANNHQLFPSLYINSTSGIFSDEAYKISTWTAAPTRDTHGGTWADFDNDGDSDLMVTTGRGNSNQFFENLNGTLAERAAQYNLTNSAWAGRQGTWFDYDNDGQLDVIVGNFNGLSDILRQGSGTFVKTTAATGVECTQMPYGQLLDVDRDGRMDLLCGRQGNSPYRIYKTTSTPFANITWQLPSVGNVADTVLADFDNNLLQDILYVRSAARAAEVAKAGSSKIEAMLPGGNKGFTYQASGLQTLDVDWRILRDDSLSRIRIGSSGYAPSAKKFTLNPNDSSNWGMPSPNNTGSAYVHIGYNNSSGVWTVMHYTGNEWSSPSILLSSAGAISNLNAIGIAATDGPFAPVLHSGTTSGYVNTTSAANLNSPVSCASGVAADFDNDMDVDLYLVCASGVRNLENRLYENRGNGVFDLVPNAGGAQGPVGVAVADGAGTADSVVVADYDVDGDIDVFVTNGMNMEPPELGGPVKLFRNRATGNNWIQFDLQGTTSNRDGIGARVIVTAGGISQLREQNGGYHRWSQDFDRLHFGLAGNTTANVRVEWPSGRVDVHNGLSANRFYRVVENGGYTALTIGQGAAPQLAIQDIGVSEGATATSIAVTLLPASAKVVTVNYSITNSTAINGNDFLASAGVLTFNPGVTTQQIPFSLIDDAMTEGDETFIVNLSNAQNAQISRASAVVTIFDNEVSACNPPAYNPAVDAGLFIWKNCTTGEWNVVGAAGGGGAKLFEGNVTSSQNFMSAVPVGFESKDVLNLDNTANPKAITFKMTMSGVWTDGFNFAYPTGSNVCMSVTSGANGIFVGETGAAVSSPFNLDTLGSCVPDSSTINIDSQSVAETAGSGVLTATLAPPSAATVSVGYTIANGSAIAGADYTAVPGTLQFLPGQTTKSIPFTILDDQDVEGDEEFTISLINAVGAVVGAGVGKVTILDNESQPSCGKPSYNFSLDTAMFLWQDCVTGLWSVRAAAPSGFLIYDGSVTSDQAFTSVTGVDLESADELVPSASMKSFSYRLRVGTSGSDGFDFSFPAGSNVCFGKSLPSGTPVLVGPGRVPVAAPLNLATLGPC